MPMTRSHTSAARRFHTKGTSLIALGSALLSLGIGSAAHAQAAAKPVAKDKPAAESADIIVTGFRRSIENANKVKKLSTQIIESISAEDIGKLPDVSITDALSRLPGVTSQVESGRATYLSIRGFGPDFTAATLNGRQITTIDDNRRFQYDQYPGDLFNRVDVIKTPSANMVTQGLAGTVDMKTIDPLSSKRVFSVNMQGEMNGYKKLNPDSTDKGYKGSVIYIDHFANNTLGISLGASAISTPSQNKQYEAWGYPTDSAGNKTLGGAKWFSTTNVLKRETGFGHVVYRPDAKFEMSLDALYTQSTTREYQRGLEVPLAWGSGPAATNVTAANGYVTSATFSNVYPVQRNNFNTRDADTIALGSNMKYAFTDTLKVSVDASYSRSHRHDERIETYSGTGYNKTGTSSTDTITLQADGTYSLAIKNVDYTDTSKIKLTDPQGWGYYNPTGKNGDGKSVVQAGYINEPDFTNTLKTLASTLQKQIDSGFFKSIDAGASYNDQGKKNDFTGYYLVPAAGSTTIDIPASAVVGTVNPDGVTGSSVIAYDVNAVLPLYTGKFKNNQPSESTNRWQVTEKSLTGYVQGNFDAIVGALPVKGNLGAQLVYTDQSSDGNTALNPTTVVASSGGAKYTYFLPSANMNIEVSHDMFVRLGAGRSMARARLKDENASYSVSTYASGNTPLFIDGKFAPLSASGGNPALRPYFSDYVDVSVEKYFARNQGKLALATYYKSITNYVDPNNSYITDLSAFESSIDKTQFPSTLTTYTTLGYVTAPANTGQGWALGAELSAVLPLSVLTPALEGFGTLGSVAYTDSSIRYANGTPVNLPGLSDWVVQGQAYFEKWGFNARGSFNYRSNFLGEYQAFGAQLQLKSTKARETVDLHLGYDFKVGQLKGLSLYVEGSNLTDSPYVSYTNNDPKQVINHEKYGPTYRAGATFKF